MAIARVPRMSRFFFWHSVRDALAAVTSCMNCSFCLSLLLRYAFAKPSLRMSLDRRMQLLQATVLRRRCMCHEPEQERVGKMAMIMAAYGAAWLVCAGQ